MKIVVTPLGLHDAVLECGSKQFRAAVGRAGIGSKQSEGDGITPTGVFALRKVLYRADRIVCPQTSLPLAAIAHDDGWCDAPDDPAYNQLVRCPYQASAEALWRNDNLYDLIVVIGFNDAPVVPGAGSAIFLHVARDDYGPTQGCIALAVSDLAEIVAKLAPGDTIVIRA
jgi:L,D-peptidoglycan transpeptidase YkuD (ErfK/YbiS/YcfS/YnhG family)